MTEVDESHPRRFPLRRMSKTARRLTKTVIPRPDIKLVVGIRVPLHRPQIPCRHKEKRIATSGFALLPMTAADASLALRGFRLLAESYPEYVSYKEMNDYGK